MTQLWLVTGPGLLYVMEVRRDGMRWTTERADALRMTYNEAAELSRKLAAAVGSKSKLRRTKPGAYGIVLANVEE